MAAYVVTFAAKLKSLLFYSELYFGNKSVWGIRRGFSRDLGNQPSSYFVGPIREQTVHEFDTFNQFLEFFWRY